MMSLHHDAELEQKQFVEGQAMSSSGYVLGFHRSVNEPVGIPEREQLPFPAVLVGKMILEKGDACFEIGLDDCPDLRRVQ